MLVVKAHILEAAMNVFGMKSLDDTPSQELFPTESVEAHSLQRRIFLNGIHKLFARFVDLSLTFNEDVECEDHRNVDTVHEYAKEVVSLGLLLFEFNDSVREGDRNQLNLTR